jgi:hypothetical protein
MITMRAVDGPPSNPNLTDLKEGMYVIGEQVQGGSTKIGYSRFTTSTGARFPTWFVGAGNPNGTCVTGDLFSRNSGSTGTTLWGCANGVWTAIK